MDNIQVIGGGTVLTLDGERRVIRDGAVAVEDDRIVRVGKTAEVRAAYPEAEFLDVEGDAVLPGLVDAHVHLAQALIRGCADDLSLIPWLTERVWVLQGSFDEEDGRTCAELCILEMLRSGTTAFVETLIAGRYGLDGIAETVEKSGIRAGLAKSIMDVATYAKSPLPMFEGMVEDKEQTFRQARELYEKWHGRGDGRIQVWLGPRPLGGSTPECLRQVAALSRELGIRMNIHFCEVRGDVEFFREQYDRRPTELFEELGLLGPDMMLIHAVWLDDEDVATLVRTGTHVVHNPASNAKLGSGIARVPDLLRAGVNVALGCDGGPSNNNYDMFLEMRLASYLNKVNHLDPTVTPAETVLEMATLGGARAMGLEKEIGSLQAAKKADLVVVDLHKPHIVPSPDPVSAVVCAARGTDVRHVMIDGRWVVRDEKVLTLDEEAVLARAAERAEALYKRAGVDIKPRWPVV
ncbi:MAG: amidohydrolase family protein [Nitrospinota bacterium]